MNASEKLESVASQIHQCMEGQADCIVCPYCEKVTRQNNESLCCDLMGKAVKAVVDRIRLADVKSQMAEVVDRAGMN